MAGPEASVVIEKMAKKLGDSEARNAMLEAYVEQLEGELRVAQHRNAQASGEANAAQA